MILDQLIQELKDDEGMRLKPYTDTKGNLTIGVGRNLTDKGITYNEAQMLLLNDIVDCEKDLDKWAPWWRDMTEVRQRALMNMCFNLGWPRLREFHSMLLHLKNGEYMLAAASALHSLWASQVGGRAQRIATMMRNG